MHEIVREEGETALARRSSSLFWSALAAGLSMGFSFLTMAMLQSSLPDTPWRHLVAGLGYSIGFMIVILGRQQLFTESTLTALLPLLTRPDRETLWPVLRLWAIVLLANLLGTLIFAYGLTVPGVFKPEVLAALGDIAQHALQGSFWSTVLRAIFAGWLIALMVWLLPSSKASSLLTILIITYVVAISNLSHVIAGSVEAIYAVLGGNAHALDYFVDFLLPTLLGNVIGGVSLVALLNHAAIAPEMVG